MDAPSLYYFLGRGRLRHMGRITRSAALQRVPWGRIRELSPSSRLFGKDRMDPGPAPLSVLSERPFCRRRLSEMDYRLPSIGSALDAGNPPADPNPYSIGGTN